MSEARKLPKTLCWHLEVANGVKVPVDEACVGIAESLEPQHILDLALASGLQHICQKNGHMYAEELKACQSLVGQRESYLEFPIASILCPQLLNKKGERKYLLVDERFDCSSQKQQVFQHVSNAMEVKGITRTIMDDVNAVTDELFTNALFNAPFVDVRTHRNPGVSRQNLEIKLDDGKSARIFLALAENRLIIGCEDPFGTLDLRQYLSKIKSTYERGPAAAMNFGPGGAGIGSYIIFNAGGSLYFGVWPGRATVLCCVVPLGMSNRQRTKLPKHLHWFQR